jgi:hydrogenase expression/formation protein HypD
VKYLTEFRDPAAARRLGEAIKAVVRRPWTLMEVCGGQTHTIVRSGIEELLPEAVTMLHGPGCPVCVTPVRKIDRSIEIASRREVIFCSFGDMLRVPGSAGSLLEAKARGADVRIVYSPLDCLRIAAGNQDRQVVFFAVGFETTAPANAMAVRQAARRGIGNFSLLVSHFRVPPAMEAILASPERRVDAFLAAGHVCTVMGYREYEPLARRHRVPIVVTGFEPLDILEGILMAVRQLEEGRAEVENQYRRAVRARGNTLAQDLIEEVFEIAPREWRGIGEIPESGLRLRAAYGSFDAERRFGGDEKEWKEEECKEAAASTRDADRCIAGEVLQGRRKPHECASFGTACTPESPLGAPMVSSEGACAAYYLYRRHSVAEQPHE